MSKKEKITPIVLIVILVFLIIELGYTLFNYIDYEKRKESGNERWQQVEERIKAIEECCDYVRNI